MIDLTFFFPQLNGVAMANNFEAKLANPPLFGGTLTFQNRFEYRNADGRVNSGEDLATSCTNLVSFESVIPEITLLICVPVWKKLSNWHIPPNISDCTGPIFTKFSDLVHI